MSSEHGEEVTVPAEAEGFRLDRCLADLFPGRTRSSLGRMIRAGHVSVGGREVRKPGHSLRAGETIAVRWPAAPGLSPEPEEIPLEVLHEDEHLIAVVKPAGMVVHQGHGRFSGTLVNALLGRGTPLSTVGAPARPGIVHRLDEGTSGVLVVAKTEAAHLGLARAFAEREVDKRYVALVWGRPTPASGQVELAIGRSRNHPTRMAVEATRGRRRPALTLYTTRESMPGFALLDIELRTGRTHQIRVHMQAIHHPIVGDERYGGRAWRGVQDPLRRRAIRELDRLALHAASLELQHPVTTETLRLVAPLPADLLDLLNVLRVAT